MLDFKSASFFALGRTRAKLGCLWPKRLVDAKHQHAEIEQAAATGTNLESISLANRVFNWEISCMMH
ncbi:hypothetical protein Csa_003468 [Cucumis sativus]|uniref:Uncharacterized protein n=1 Tax=Cucumis sativus TaxID=3659 RepID=A0A0A0KEA9_CUCSA|nr:hypothetical protein Csa_003468 [Cucumis sativus]